MALSQHLVLRNLNLAAELMGDNELMIQPVCGAQLRRRWTYTAGAAPEYQTIQKAGGTVLSHQDMKLGSVQHQS
jgi:hypothetical protein